MAVKQNRLPESPFIKAHSLLDEARTKYVAGDIEGAQRLCEKSLELNPFSPEGLFLTGNLLDKLGRSDEATEFLERAIATRPAFAPFRVGLGSHYLLKRRLNDAVQAFEEAIFLDSRQAKPYLNLGLLYMATGKPGKGFKSVLLFFSRFFRGRAFGLKQRIKVVLDGDAAVAKEKALLRRGLYQEVISLLNQRLETNNSSWRVYLLLSKAYQMNGAFQKAIETVDEGLEGDPALMELLCAKAETFTKMGRLPDALETLENVAAEDRNKPAYLISLGTVLFRNNQGKDALKVFSKVRKKNRNAKFLVLQGRCLAGTGKLEEATENFRRAIAADKTHGGAYTALAKAKGLEPGDPCFRKLFKQFKNPLLPQEDRMRLYFAAARAYVGAGEYDKAFEFYNKGNALRDLPFDQEAWASFVGRQIEVFGKKFITGKRKFGSKSDKPIFIVGMPRSGTTLTEQILAAHPKVSGGGEREMIMNFARDFPKRFEPEPAWPEAAVLLNKENCGELYMEYLEHLERIFPEAERITDKMPGNFVHLGLIGILFPEAKIVHCRRDPVDTCLSNYMQPYMTFHPYAFDLGHLGFYYRQYEKLMAHWHKVMPGRILDFEYEKVISNPEKEAKKLLKFCGLPWDPVCLEFHKAKTTVQTSSFAQVRQPIYKTSSQKWRKYEKHLGPLLEALGKN